VSKAIVVGSGPNGLSCAVELARAGLDVTVLEAEPTIGGGTRSSELTVPGVIHDECSAVHPMAIGSPFLRSLGLERHGLEWLFPEVDLAHPLDDGSAGVLVRSIDETADGLGSDGGSWRRVFERPSRGFESLNDDLLRPFLHFPRHPFRLARFGLAAMSPATVLARAFETPQAKALFGGVAAHSFAPLTQPMSSAVGVALISACHAFGWGVARGGSQSIANALAAELAEHGGTIETSVRVTALSEVQADIVALDMSPSGIADMLGDRLPSGVARAYRRYKHGPAAYKLDLAVEGGVPWTNEACRRAGTVHVGGTFEEIVQTERENNQGRMPERPYILVAQQYLADPSRSEGDVHPVWAYAHVPHGYDGNAEQALIDQLERFAPGVRERIVATHVRTPAELQAHNANYIGGDIVTGANTPKQILIRPRLSLNPYSTGIPGVYICSAASPPGGGVHGMCGYNAAQAALNGLRGR
jgi:phytoene dehydrogenase-like protein